MLSMQTVVAQQIGRGNVEEAREQHRSSKNVSVVIILILATSLCLLKKPLLYLFLDEDIYVHPEHVG